MKEKKDFEWKKLKYYKGSKNGHFLKGLKHGVLSKKSNFFLSAFFTEILSESIVFDIVERKE